MEFPVQIRLSADQVRPLDTEQELPICWVHVDIDRSVEKGTPVGVGDSSSEL